MNHRINILLFVLFVICNICVAQHVDSIMAVNTASLFINNKIIYRNLENSETVKILNNIKYFYGESGLCLYGINLPDSGWVVVSADKRIRPVLAYSTSGSLPDNMEEIPIPMVDVLNSYIEEVDFAKNNISTNVIHNEWYSPVSRAVSDIIVHNLLMRNGLEVLWNQQGNQDYNNGLTADCERVYNKFCPAFYNTYNPCSNHAYVGCTAVAMAQVMWYWQWPYFAQVPLVMLDSLGNTSGTTMHHYDWNKATNILTNSTEISQVDMVAGILRDCGYCANIKYGKEGSAASLLNAVNALKNNFGYSNSLYKTNRPTEQSQQTLWINQLKAELNASRPIIYAGFDSVTGGSGHAFVIAGYNSNDYFYVNWGYGKHGSSDYNAFVSLNNMEINDKTYNYRQQAIFGIEPAPICSSKKPSTQQA